MKVKQPLTIVTNAGSTSYEESAPSPINSPSMLLKTPDPTMKFYGNLFADFFFPEKQTTTSKFLNMILVTPLTNFTFFSMFYQLYLNEIFHTKFFTRITHIVNMPLHVLCIMTLLNQWQLYKFDEASGVPAFYSINMGLVFAFCLLIYYSIWGILSKLYLFGIFTVLPLGTLWLLSTCIYHVHGNPTMPWYNPLEPWWLNPLLWLVITAFIQSAGHAFEPHLPPHISGTDDWIKFETFTWGNSKNPFPLYKVAGRYLFLLLAICWGAFDEFCASIRLFPLNILRYMFSLGYAPEYWKEIRYLTHIATQGNFNPATNFVGRGGSRWSHDMYTKFLETYEKHKKKLHLPLAWGKIAAVIKKERAKEERANQELMVQSPIVTPQLHHSPVEEVKYKQE